MTTSGVEGVVNAPIDTLVDEELAKETRLRRAYNVAKRAVQASVIAVELSPANEAIRFGAYVAALTQTQNPVVGAAVLGGTTLVVEGTAALATASILDTEKSNKGIDWINNKINKHAPNGVKMSPPTEAGAAMVGGSAVVLALKQIENPGRTISQNRKHGLFTASWMSAYFAAEGALVAEGIDDFNDPKKVGVALIAVGGLAAISRKAKKHFQREAENAEKNPADATPKPITSETYGYNTLEIIEKNPIGEDEIELAIELNDKHRNLSDEAVKIGLYGEDVKSALENPDSVLVKYPSEDGQSSVYAPLLVPVESLEWYNHELLKDKYGENTGVYYYASPPIPSTEGEKEKVTTKIKDLIEQGSVVIYDYYPSQPHIIDEIHDEQYTQEDLGRGLAAGQAEVFSGVLKIGQEKHIVKSPGLNDVYQDCVKNGELIHDTQNGVTLETTISDEESEKVWKIYEGPFERLSKDDAMYASLDKKMLLAMLKDPSVMKILNRNKGEVTTLCFFTNEFKNCPWFNAEYYKKKYSEYYDTENIFMFPGIVTGDSLKGQSYSLKLIDFAVRLAAKRGTDTMITFECSPISKMYIPRIVRRAINKSGAGFTEDFTTPVSSMGYKVLRKNNKHDN